MTKIILGLTLLGTGLLRATKNPADGNINNPKQNIARVVAQSASADINAPGDQDQKWDAEIIRDNSDNTDGYEVFANWFYGDPLTPEFNDVDFKKLDQIVMAPVYLGLADAYEHRAKMSQGVERARAQRYAFFYSLKAASSGNDCVLYNAQVKALDCYLQNPCLNYGMDCSLLRRPTTYHHALWFAQNLSNQKHTISAQLLAKVRLSQMHYFGQERSVNRIRTTEAEKLLKEVSNQFDNYDARLLARAYLAALGCLRGSGCVPITPVVDARLHEEVLHAPLVSAEAQTLAQCTQAIRQIPQCATVDALEEQLQHLRLQLTKQLPVSAQTLCKAMVWCGHGLAKSREFDLVPVERHPFLAFVSSSLKNILSPTEIEQLMIALGSQHGAPALRPLGLKWLFGNKMLPTKNGLTILKYLVEIHKREPAITYLSLFRMLMHELDRQDSVKISIECVPLLMESFDLAQQALQDEDVQTDIRALTQFKIALSHAYFDIGQKLYFDHCERAIQELDDLLAIEGIDGQEEWLPNLRSIISDCAPIEDDDLEEAESFPAAITLLRDYYQSQGQQISAPTPGSFEDPQDE